LDTYRYFHQVLFKRVVNPENKIIAEANGERAAKGKKDDRYLSYTVLGVFNFDATDKTPKNLNSSSADHGTAPD